MSRIRVVAAMSGGVDSAVAAAVLAERGYDVVGVTMRTYTPTRPAYAKSCCGIDDVDDARRAAATLGIPYYVLDVRDEFARTVLGRFAADYAAGRTPNPCVDCNDHLKLGALLDYADRVGAAYVATGHHARVEHRDDGAHLYRVPGPKDQAYALAHVGQARLSRLLLPLEGRSKEEVRADAARFGLAVAAKPDSQDLCFTEGRSYAETLRELAPAAFAPGEIRDTAGAFVGRHDGIGNFTVGQRRGVPGGAGPARYVTQIDAPTATIVIGALEDLAVGGLVANEFVPLREERFEPHRPVRVLAMTRYRATPAAATATLGDGDALELTFDEIHRGVTPGQLVALVDPCGDEVLGAARIAAGRAA